MRVRLWKHLGAVLAMVAGGQLVGTAEWASADEVQRLATMMDGSPLSRPADDGYRAPQVDRFASYFAPETVAAPKSGTGNQLPSCCTPSSTGTCPLSGCKTDAPSCCDQAPCCDDVDDCCCRPKMFIAGAEVTFLAPHFSRGHDVAIITDDINANTQTVYDGGNANVDGMTAGPRVWLGYQYETWGFQTRYWELTNVRQERTGAIIGNNTLSDSSLDAYTLDFEVTRRFAGCCRNLLFSFGVRNANIDNNGSLSIVETTSTGTLLRGAAAAGTEFNGTGLTLGIQGLHPIGCGHLNLFWRARGSLLWGESTARADTFGSLNSLAAAGEREDHAIAISDDDDLFIGELQAGLQWDYPLECLPASAFFRVAFEYQYWDTGVGQAGTLSTVGVAGDAAVTSTALADGLSMHLYGFTVGTGFYW